jgi:hypothetical protein
MEEMSDFQVGDRVRHIGMGIGTVIKTGETVDVHYDRVSGRGKHSTGVYDAAWFRLHPGALVLTPLNKE